VVVNNYVSPDVSAIGGTTTGATTTAQATAPQPPPANQQALTLFDNGLAQFKAGSYPQSLTSFDGALKQLPNDPVVHEVRALSLFANGQYTQAAAALNALLATAPGMDWTTMSSLYGSVDDYTAQLRKLEDYCKSNPKDAPAYFVLAYHYLVTGHQDNAVQALKIVVADQPRDVTAKKMLDALSPPAQATATAATPPAATPPAATATTAEAGPQTDLVGTWQAKGGNSTIELTIGEDAQFTWKASDPGKPAIQLTGTVDAASDTLVLESKEQGSMGGTVKSEGPDKWRFALSGAAPGDPGLSFERVKR
jgi:tetratricopeptide (TPR) repeat protein